MRVSFSLVSALAALAQAENYLGFNSGSTKADYSAKVKADYLAEFKTAQALQGAPGTFNAVRLYTNVQAFTKNDPIAAFEAAIETQTKILLGVWASGVTNIDGELSALKKAVAQYGSKFTDLVIGISIGSEDLYRNSTTGVANKAGVGAGPSVILGFINDFKKAFDGTALGKTPVGHVETWDVWPNADTKPVLDALDWVGVDEYPYYENGKVNDIKNSGYLFAHAYQSTVVAAAGKPVWVTETGWPTSGPAWDQAVPSVENAKYYWDEVGCGKLFNKVPTFWYNLRDSNPVNSQTFAVSKDLTTTPVFNLTCPNTSNTPMASGSTNGTGSTSGSSGGNTTNLPRPTGGGSGGNTTNLPSPTGGGSGGGSSTNSPAAATSAPTGNGAAGMIQALPLIAYAGLAVAGALAMS